MKFLTTLCTCLFIFSVCGQAIVDKSVIEDGGTFTVTCDATRAGVPTTTVDYVSSLVLLIKGTAFTELARYRPYPPYAENYTNDQYFGTRNWTYQFSGGRGGTDNTPVNRNTIKIVIQMNEAKCADAGLYFCNASYIQNKNDLTSSNFYNVTSKAKIQQPILILTPHNEVLGDPSASINQAGTNITFKCTVMGPTGLNLLWRYGKSDQGVENYPYQNHITSREPTASGSCNQYSYESSLLFPMDSLHDGYTFYCSVQDSNSNALSANLTVYTQPTTKEPDADANTADAGINVGAIVGPIIGGLVLIAIIVVVVYFCWYRKRDTTKDKDREPDATDSNVHAPPPTFYAKPHKQPKEEKDNIDSGKINKGLDLSYEHEDSKGPPRYTNTVDDDNEPPRYDRGRSNKGYDEDNNKEERSRRHRDREDRKDREGRKSRSRDPDEEPRRRYSTDDNTDNRDYTPYGDPGMGTAI
ncbi:uncharacterized protein LOC131946978 [Physella acuta]|uniref:uncharacterized protein LOC131946978 n=1 Tax=Physella acuta TaxID=109671 RepID=UPI0027DAD4CC|nr:uncharacterized protein LOC131946978 [Physella acuta]